MRASSAKNKGRRLENYLREIFKTQLDDGAYKTSGSGSGIDKGDVRIPAFNMVVEAKNKAVINLLTDWEQAKSQAFNEIPILAIRNPKMPEFKEVLMVMDLDTFLHILTQPRSNLSELETSSRLSYKQKNLLNNLKSSVSRVLNEWDKED